MSPEQQRLVEALLATRDRARRRGGAHGLTLVGLLAVLGVLGIRDAVHLHERLRALLFALGLLVDVGAGVGLWRATRARGSGRALLGGLLCLAASIGALVAGQRV